MSAHPHRSRHASSVRHRFAVASRALAALVGGYGLATAFTVALGRALELPKEEVVNTAALPAFLLYAGAAVWAFYASNATRAWLGIGLPAAVLALVAWLLRATPAA
ncbi:MAG: hypothetical protein K0R17_1262 [Rariglobus sp.]|jgi:hypothetical protein|nr:hypothetical protein [Rariglobus sp.]